MKTAITSMCLTLFLCIGSHSIAQENEQTSTQPTDKAISKKPAPLSAEETRFKWLFLAHFLAAAAELSPEEEDDVNLFAILGQRAIDRMSPEDIPAPLRGYVLDLSALIRKHYLPIFPNTLPFAELNAEMKKLKPHFKTLEQRYPEASKRFNMICHSALYDGLPAEVREAVERAEKHIRSDEGRSHDQQINLLQSKLLLDWLNKTSH